MLISGDVICNVNLAEVIDQHKARRKVDKECIMTMIFKQAPSTCRTRSLGDDLVVALDGKDNRILKYYDDPSDSNMEFDVPCFKDHTSIQFRYDLLDCNVDVCSLSMVDRIADEYDVQDLRKHFVTREVADRELGLKIHGHVVTHEYAARVFDPRTYDSIASDVIRRWAYPFTIDSNFLTFGASTFTCARGNRYREENVSVGSNTIIGPNTVLGNGTRVSDHVTIHGSTIGKNGIIEKNAQVHGCHIWSNVSIGENATIDRAILCDGVRVGKGATVGRGCVLSYGVVIGDNVIIPEFTRLTRVPRTLVQKRVRVLEGWDDTYDDEDEDSNNETNMSEGNTNGGDDDWGDGTSNFDWKALLETMSPETDVHIVGPDGVGRVWDPSEEEEDHDEEEKLTARRKMIARSIGAVEHETSVDKRWEEWGQRGEDLGETPLLRMATMGGWDDECSTAVTDNGNDGNNKEEEKKKNANSATDGEGTNGTNEGTNGNNQGDTDIDFENTIHDWIQDFRKDDSQDMKMQIRMYALQVDIEQRSKASSLILSDVLNNDLKTTDDSTEKEIRAEILKLLKRWQYVLKSFVQDYSHAGLACLIAIEDHVCDSKRGAQEGPAMRGAFPYILMALYSELELLDYDAIREWMSNTENDESNEDGAESTRSLLYKSSLVQRVLSGIKSQEEGGDDDSDGSSGGSGSSSGSSSDSDEE